MLTLRSSPASPYGRKVKIAAAVLGLSDRITVEQADTNNPEDSLRKQNPLGKIPALILEDGKVLYDSRVIVEYLDQAVGGKLIPAGEARFAALTMQALADGMTDAAILQVYEIRFRPEELRSADWVAYQTGKVERALAALESDPPATVTPGSTPDIGQIAVACALGYQDLRFEGKWRQSYPKLVEWLAAFDAAIPAFEATRMKT
ncbi:glutathione S-transferase [Stappia sp. F7233]|uniref:Glutathione S-transferase n=1 Tax=Stappia albiluteola TaxID=2758565 RepID=A0A839A8C6_9HYPH|nr:glutathione S-transferase [Stappia albiluteola]MBA5775783.1 glutathione S-transferase [Stappia albiluteola]